MVGHLASIHRILDLILGTVNKLILLLLLGLVVIICLVGLVFQDKVSLHSPGCPETLWTRLASNSEIPLPLPPEL